MSLHFTGHFTSGPLTVEDTQILTEWDGNTALVGQASHELPWHEDKDCANNEAHANALLWAAAPELLEACQAFADVTFPINQAYEMCLAAIKKATKP